MISESAQHTSLCGINLHTTGDHCEESCPRHGISSVSQTGRIWDFSSHLLLSHRSGSRIRPLSSWPPTWVILSGPTLRQDDRQDDPDCHCLGSADGVRATPSPHTDRLDQEKRVFRTLVSARDTPTLSSVRSDDERGRRRSGESDSDSDDSVSRDTDPKRVPGPDTARGVLAGRGPHTTAGFQPGHPEARRVQGYAA